MPATYEPIATTTLASAAASITFGSIPNTYTDLRVVLVCTTNLSGDAYLRFNSDTATNYSQTYLLGNGSAAQSGRITSSGQINLHGGISGSATVPELLTADVFGAFGATNKTVLTTASADLNGSGAVYRAVGLWRSTAAITTLNLVSPQNFNAGTTATLYGIKAA